MDLANNTMRQTILESVFECVNKVDAANQRRFSSQDAKIKGVLADLLPQLEPISPLLSNRLSLPPLLTS